MRNGPMAIRGNGWSIGAEHSGAKSAECIKETGHTPHLVADATQLDVNKKRNLTH